jgi:hypothetical protein
MNRATLISLLALASTAWGTTFMQQPFPDAVSDAPIIVRGHIGSSVADWGSTADGQRRIYTSYDLSLAEVLKGQVATQPGSSLAIRELGGVKGGIGMQVAGTAHFDPGEDVVVFLNNRNPDGSYDIRGMMMGKLSVKQDENGNESLIGPALAERQGNGIVQDDAVGQAQGGTGASGAWTLDRLRHLIADQKSGHAGTESSQKPKAFTAATPLASPRPSLRAASPSPAPGLQPSDTEEAGPGSGVWSRLGLPFTLVALLIAAAAVFLWRRRN